MNSDCGEWMHIDCLREDVLKRVHDRLGADKPHIPVVKEMNSTETYLSIERQSAKPPLNAVTMEEGLPTDIISVQAETSTGVMVKCREESDSRSAEWSTPVISQTARHSKRLARKKTGRPRESEAKAYLEPFQATLRMSDGPMVWEIKDLRPSFAGSAKTWSESVLCLLCGADMK